MRILVENFTNNRIFLGVDSLFCWNRQILTIMEKGEISHERKLNHIIP